MSALVSTQKPSVLVILRREYLEIAGGNFCAAKKHRIFQTRLLSGSLKTTALLGYTRPSKISTLT
jgi:hypothetical protein